MASEEPETLKTLAFLDGWLAHQAGLRTNLNLYHPQSQKASHDEWLAGYFARSGRADAGTLHMSPNFDRK